MLDSRRAGVGGIKCRFAGSRFGAIDIVSQGVSVGAACVSSIGCTVIELIQGFRAEYVARLFSVRLHSRNARVGVIT